jgi:hypothetical protein
MQSYSRIFQASWTLLSVASAYPIWALTVGSAAWNGVNFAVCVYLIASTGGILGLLAGFWSAFSPRRVPSWTTSASAAAIACLSLVYTAGFIFARDPGVPWNDPFYLGIIHAPLIAFYAAGFVCCSLEALIYFPRIRKPKSR